MAGRIDEDGMIQPSRYLRIEISMNETHMSYCSNYCNGSLKVFCPSVIFHRDTSTLLGHPMALSTVASRTSSPLKAPVTEILDLHYDHGILPTPDETKPNKLDLGDEDNWSLYEDALEGGSDDCRSPEGSGSGRLHAHKIYSRD